MIMSLLGFSLAPDLELEFETGLDQKWNFEAERILTNESNEAPSAAGGATGPG